MIRKGALRRLTRALPPAMRSGRLLSYALLAWLGPVAIAAAETWQTAPLLAAEFTEPTARYPHGALGDEIEYGALVLHYGAAWMRRTIRLPQDRVFEDTNPRLVDVDRDGRAEAIVVESHRDQGARLAIYDGGGLMAATPYIGRRFRWLAPIGAADLDGDGHIEIAYIDRPHLAKTLRIWRFRDGALEQVAQHPGLTNHRIGDPAIAGGIRDCAGTFEMIVASEDWRFLVAVTFDGLEIDLRTLKARADPTDFAAALRCDPAFF